MQPWDLALLRRTFVLAREAVRLGDQPYGALLADASGAVMLESLQTRARTGDVTGHAETELCRQASLRWRRDVLAACTVYSSTEPCPMCAGAIGWTAGRLVFGLSQAASYRLWPLSSPRFRKPISCRVVLGDLQPPMEVIGPLLEEEAAAPHHAWLESHAGA